MKDSKPPQINPFIFPFGLLCFGLWFFYDGWISTDPEMQKHLMFNRVGSVILLGWSVYDFIRTWQGEKAYRERTAGQKNGGEA